MLPCPSIVELEEFLAGKSRGAVSEHVASCASCESALTGLRANLALAAQVRGVVRGKSQHAESAPPPAELPGYRFQGLIGEGAQGSVYRATQESTKRAVAIKFLRHGAFSSPRQRRRFEREIDLVASLRHPGIVTVHESGTAAGGQLYCVMEFVDGRADDARRTRARIADEEAQAGAR